MILSVTTDVSRVSVSSLGGYITNWQVLNSGNNQWVELLYQGTELKRTGIPILFPNFGSSEVLPNHGFARNSTFDINKVNNGFELSLTASTIAKEFVEVYPYAFTLTVAVILDNADLIYQMKVVNQSNKAMPIAPGIHPYWPIVQDKKKLLKIEGVANFNANEIDWAKNPPDTPYDFKGKAKIIFPDRTLTIEDITSPNQVAQKLVIWSQTPEKEDFHFVCVEPVTRFHGGFDHNPIMIDSGKEWEMKLRISVNIL